MDRRVLNQKQEEHAVVRDMPCKPGWMCIDVASYSLYLTPIWVDQGVLVIPEVFNSKATLESFGFRPEVAADIFATWEAALKTSGYRHDVVTEAKKYVRRVAEWDNASAPEHDLRRALEGMGMRPGHIDRILRASEAFAETKPASDWMLDYIDTAWSFLERLDYWIRVKRDERLDWFCTVLVMSGWIGLEHVAMVREAVLAGRHILLCEGCGIHISKSQPFQSRR